VKKTETEQYKVLKELAGLIYFCYDGNEKQLGIPTKRDFIDILEGLRHLKVLIKYMKFDIEATRREVDYLKGLLKGK